MAENAFLEVCARNGWNPDMIRSLGFGNAPGFGAPAGEPGIEGDAAAFSKMWMDMTSDPQQQMMALEQNRLFQQQLQRGAAPPGPMGGPPDPKAAAQRKSIPGQQPPPMINPQMAGNILLQMPGMPGSSSMGSPAWGAPPGIPAGSIMIPQASSLPQTPHSGTSTPKNASLKKTGPPSPPTTPGSSFALPNMGDANSELMKSLPKHVLDALQMRASPKAPPKEEGGNPWGRRASASAPDGSDSQDRSQLYSAKRQDPIDRNTSGPKSFSELRAARADGETAEDDCSPKDGPEPGREEMFGVESAEAAAAAAAAEKTLPPGFTPTRGKYKGATKLTQLLGIEQCSLPDGTKGFAAGRGKCISVA